MLRNYGLTDNREGHLCYLGVLTAWQLHHGCVGRVRAPAHSRCSVTLGILQSEHSANWNLCS